MAGSIIAGFPPAASGAGKAPEGLAPAAGAVSPRGGFGSLIELRPTVGFLPAGKAAAEIPAPGVAGLPAPLGVEFGLEPPPLPEPDGERLLGDLVDAHGRLDRALADGEPVDPEVAERLAEAIDALAGMLGVALPDDGADPVPPAACGEARAEPVVTGNPSSEEPAGASPITNEIEALPAKAGALAPPLVSDSTLAPPPPGDRVETPPAIDPASSLGQLIDRLTALARALEPQVPGLAKRLEALVEKLGSSEISHAVLAELGLDQTAPLAEAEINQAIARLLGLGSEAKGTPAPQAFAALQLWLPANIALPLGPGSDAPVAPAAAEAPARSQPPLVADADADGDAAEAKGVVYAQPAARHGAAEVKAAATRSEAPAEPAPAVQPAMQAAAVVAATAGAAKAVHAAYQAPVHQINIPQVAFEVVRQIQAANTRFQIRLDPPELGRIDVKLDLDRNGNVNARMTVERAETLDLMQRDQRTLERALAQAGLDSARTNLEFSLRQNPFGREDGGDGHPNSSPFADGAGGETAGLEGDLPKTQSLYRGSIGASGVNLFV